MTTPPPSMPAAYDVLGTPEPAPRRGRVRALVIGVVGAGALAVAGGAMAVASFLGGGGAQPEDVLPADVLGLVKLDLDPAAGQKIAVYRLAKKFPSTAKDVQDEESVKDSLLSALLDDAESVDYAKDVQPWIGDRVAVALVPGVEVPQPLVAVAYTDRAAAQRALDSGVLDGDEESFYAFSDKADYVLIGPSQEVVDEAATAKEVLAGSASWDKGMAALDGDQIVTLWADLDAIYAALPQQARADAASIYGVGTDFSLGGTFVAGAHAADDHVEVVGKAIDLETPMQVSSPIGGGAGSGLVLGLPADTVAALSLTNVGAGLTESFGAAYGKDDPLGLLAGAEQLGLSLPADLVTLLGDELVAGVFGKQDVALRSAPADVGAAYEKALGLATMAGGGDPSTVLRRLPDGLAAGTTPRALDAISTAGGGLGDSPQFRAAVPDAGDAGYLVYVDIARALELADADLGAGADDARALRALGLSGSADATSGTFRLRVTVGG